MHEEILKLSIKIWTSLLLCGHIDTKNYTSSLKKQKNLAYIMTKWDFASLGFNQGKMSPAR